jgi:excisionase family DNA binding protein
MLGLDKQLQSDIIGNTMNEFLTIKQICQALKISRPTIYRWFKSGLKYYKFGKAVRVKKEDLEAFISNMER